MQPTKKLAPKTLTFFTLNVLKRLLFPAIQARLSMYAICVSQKKSVQLASMFQTLNITAFPEFLWTMTSCFGGRNTIKGFVVYLAEPRPQYKDVVVITHNFKAYARTIFSATHD